MGDYRDNQGPRMRPRGGERRFQRSGRGSGGPRRERPELNEQDLARVRHLLQETEEKLADSIEAAHFDDLSPLERKHVHEFFEYKLDFETKTYRDGEKHVLWVFPVGNLKKFALAKANEAVESGDVVVLKPMSNYERFIIHDALKDMESVETSSEGEGAERHVVISPAKFGRRLKRIAKKIKLF
jgi:hypothetical protein